MNKEFKKVLLDKLGEILINQNFSIADLGNNYCVYHRRNEDHIEIIQWAEDKYKTYLTVSASIAFLDTKDEKSNINFKWFKEVNNEDYDKLNVDDCFDKYFLKGNFGECFYYTDVYLALGQGIIGLRQKDKKPFGIRLKKSSSSTYQEICDLIIKRLPRIYTWLDEKRRTRNSIKPGKDVKLRKYIQEYINLIDKYTDIKILKNNVTNEVKKGIKGKFYNLYDCITYLNHRKEYAIRFNDDMKADEFDNVFQLLLNDLGAPDFFSEWDGYIWKRQGYFITFGLISLNYNYEVPMICVKKAIGILTSHITYKKYSFIANSMSEPLIERGVNPQRMTYYKIGYFKEFGFSAYVKTLTKFIGISYNKFKLSISISPIGYEGNNEIIANQNKYNKEIKIIDELELKHQLEKLLEETKEHHGLTK